jgi:GTP-binding protein
LLNIFRLAECYFIDLPGYGFAQASHGTRAGYRELLEKLLRERESLTAVVWLLDVRHPPSKDDGMFHALLTDSGRAVLAVLTKADKLSQSRQEAAVIARASELGLPRDQVLLVSAQTGLGIADLATSLLAAAASVS